MSPAKTAAQRKADERRRHKEAGRVVVTNLWAHPDDVQAIREAAAKIARRRERAAQATNRSTR